MPVACPNVRVSFEDNESVRPAEVSTSESMPVACPNISVSFEDIRAMHEKVHLGWIRRCI